VRIGQAGAGANTNYMDGDVTSYDAATGALVVNATATGGSGTFNAWSVRAAPQQPLSGAQTLNTSAVLTASSPTVNLLAFTAHGGSVTLPAANTMATGAAKFVLDNTAGLFPVGVLNGAGQVMGQVLPGDSVQLHLTDATSTAGHWRHSGNFDPVWITAEIALSLTRPQSSAQIFTIDATRALVYWRQASTNYPMCRVVNWTSPSATPTVSAEIVIRAASDSLSSSRVFALDATRALLILASDNVVVLDTATPSVGTAVSATLTGGSISAVATLDNQYAVVLRWDSSTAQVRARCVDCGTSGTSATAGSDVSTTAISGATSGSFINSGGLQQVSSTVLGLMGYAYISITYYAHWAFTLTRTSGTALSFSSNAGAPPSARTSNTTQNVSQLHPLSASTALLWYWSNSKVRYVVITYASGSATWGTSVESGVITSSSDPYAFAASPDRTRFVAARCLTNGACTVEAFTVSGATVTLGSSTSFSAETASSSPSISTLAVTNEGRGLIFWKGRAHSSGPDDKVRLFTLSGTTFTFGAEASSTDKSALGSSLTSSYSVSSRQQYVGNNLFEISAGTSNSYGYVANRTILFQIAADATMRVLAEVDAVSFNGFTTRAGSDALLIGTSSSQSAPQERIFVNATTGRTQRARVPFYRLSNDMTNGQTAWSNLQRGVGLGVLSHYTLPGSNALLQTHRLAEV